MKFSCTQENLNRGLTTIGHVAYKNNNLPILQNVLIRANDGQVEFFATNLEVGIQVSIRGKVDEAGEFTVPAQLLSNYINLLTTERVDCVVEDKELKITSETQHTVIKGEATTDFPLLPKVEKTNGYSLARAQLEQGLRQVIIASSIDESRPEIAGVLFNFNEATLTLAATDSYRLAEKRVKLDTAAKLASSILPYHSTQELSRVLETIPTDQVDLYITDHQLICTGGGVEFFSRVIEGHFPDYQQIIVDHGTTTVTTNTKELIRAIKGAALFSKDGVNDIVLSSVATQGVQVKAVNTRLGENTTTLLANVTGPEVSVVFNYRYLLEGLQQLGSIEVKICLMNTTGPVVFYPITEQPRDYLYIVMPIKQ